MQNQNKQSGFKHWNERLNDVVEMKELQSEYEITKSKKNLLKKRGKLLKVAWRNGVTGIEV